MKNTVPIENDLPPWLPVVVGAGIAIFTLVLWATVHREEQVHIEDAIHLHLTRVKDQIEEHTEEVIEALERIAKRWEYRNRMDRAEWEADATNYVKGSPSYQAIEWVDAAFQARWVVPVKGNEAVQETFHGFDESRRKALETARDRRKTTLTSALQLQQGGKGFLVCVPIFVGDRSEGFIVGVFQSQKLFDFILRNVATDCGVSVLLGPDEVFFRGDDPRTHQKRWGQETSLNLHEAHWQIRVWPTPALLSKESSFTDDMILWTGLPMAVLLATTIFLTQTAHRRARAIESVNRSLEDEIVVRKQVEETLRESEARFRSIAESASEAIVSANADGAIITWNKGAQNLFGYTEKEILGKPLTLLMPERHRDAHNKGLERFRSTGQARIIGKTVELHGMRNDGAEFPMDLSLSAWKTEQAIFFGAILRDITERKRNEEFLANRSRLSTFVSEVGIALNQRGTIPEMLRPCAEAMVKHLDAALARIWTLNAAENMLELQASAGMYTHINGAHGRVPVGRFKIGLIAQEQKPHLTNSVIGDPRVPEQEWARKNGLVAFAGYPMMVEDRLIGVMAMFARQPLSEITLEAMASIANEIGRGIDHKWAETKLESVHKELLDVSRGAGMADVATNVLHNVGNVLNSINVSSTLVSEKLRKSKVANLGKAAVLLCEHANDLPVFLTQDPKGTQLPGYLTSLAQHLAEEQAEVLKEIESLTRNIEHIKEIVAMQQSYSRVSGVIESLPVTDLVEDALRMNTAALARHDVQVIREYIEKPVIAVEKHKVLQILVNLIRNAKYALDDGKRPDKRLNLRVEKNGAGLIRISVSDNGVGIAPENLTRIFEHRFTTRKEGHGFGLHSGALAAKEMGGTLIAQSDGPGKGAAFILDLPCKREKGADAQVQGSEVHGSTVGKA
ncbi:MAG: PAS domain S-box protein [Verrucomicrobia bacterium]|nr:PAS domain S-box protein [Verrucomicrobiota bacterium]